MLIPHEIVEFYSDELNIQNFHLIKNDDFATYKMNQLNLPEELDSSKTFYTSIFLEFWIKRVYFLLKIVFIFSEKILFIYILRFH